MDIDLSQVQHWIYGAEGNETIVLRYVGDHSLLVCLFFILVHVLCTNSIHTVDWICLALEEANYSTKGSRSFSSVFTGLLQPSHCAFDWSRIYGAIGKLLEPKRGSCCSLQS